MCRTFRFIMGTWDHFHPYGQNTCKNSKINRFSKNTQNVQIYHGNFFGVTIIFTHTKCPKHFQNSQTKHFPKMIRTSRFIMGFFWGLWSFLPIHNGQNTCKNSQTKNFSANAKNVIGLTKGIYNRLPLYRRLDGLSIIY